MIAREWRSVLVGAALLTVLKAPAADVPTPPPYGRGFDIYTSSAGMALSGTVLYMTWPSGPNAPERWLIALDVANPRQPTLLGRLSLDGFPQGVAVAGSHAFVVNGLDLLVADIAKPASPVLANRLAIADNPLFGPQGIAVKGTMAYLACRRGGVKAVDISNPRDPKVVATREVAGFARDVSVVGDCLYVANDARGVQVLDIRKPGEPRDMGRVAAPQGCIGHVRVDGQTAYLAGGDIAVASLSLKDPSRPKWLGGTSDRHVHSPYFGGYSHDIALVRAAGSDKLYACAADGESGLIVLDVTQPAAPAFAGATMVGVGLLTGVCGQGTTVFVYDDSYGLRVVDVTMPTNPVVMGEGVRLVP